MRLILMIVSASLVLGGCAAHHGAKGDPEVDAESHARGEGKTPEENRVPAVAAGDEQPDEDLVEASPEKVHARERPHELFAPLNLPTASERRLASGAPGPDYWQQRVDYTIDAELNADEQHLDADMVVRYHNNSPHELTYLWIQLEQNLFKDDSLGTLSRSRGGVMREADEPLSGGYTITKVCSGNRKLEFTVYDTLGRLELPEPIEAGECFTFEMSYSFEMPPHLRRMGAEEVDQGTIFEYAQWFPHVCVYDDVYGWNTLPYLGTGEFYTNYGDFDVRVTVPRDHLVAATGVLQNPEEVMTSSQMSRLLEAMGSEETVVIREADEVADPGSRPAGEGPLTWHFKASDVRTFAWASSESFLWDACAAKITDLEGDARLVLCQSLYPVEAEEAWGPEAEQGGSSQYVKHAIEFYSDWLHPYPYPVMSNINGPEGGMEYPMIVFCGGRKGRGPYGVTDHEVGHTWFPMIVNTDERRHIWMDEGFNTFINGYSNAAFRERQAELHGEDADHGGRRRTGRGGRGWRSASRETSHPIAVPADHMDGRNVGALGYSKTGVGLRILREHVLGEERFDTAFQEYIRRWVFKSPQPADFFRTMEDAAGADLAWFWRGWFYETGVLDFGISNVSVEDGTLRFIVNSYGEQVMPVEYEIVYGDGSSERGFVPVQAWFSSNEKLVRKVIGERAVVRIAVDPEGVLPDADEGDNVWGEREEEGE